MNLHLKHFLSLLAFGLFLWMAFACDDGYDDDYEHPPCDPIEEQYYEMGYFTCNSIEYTDRQNEFNLTFLDKITGEKLQGIAVDVSFNSYAMDTIHCSGQCFGKLQWVNIDEWGAYTETSDENGKINGMTGIARYWDARDVQVVSFRIYDPSGKYSSKLSGHNFYHYSGTYNGVIYLLNNDLL